MYTSAIRLIKVVTYHIQVLSKEEIVGESMKVVADGVNERRRKEVSASFKDFGGGRYQLSFSYNQPDSKLFDMLFNTVVMREVKDKILRKDKDAVFKVVKQEKEGESPVEV